MKDGNILSRFQLWSQKEKNPKTTVTTSNFQLFFFFLFGLFTHVVKGPHPPGSRPVRTQGSALSPLVVQYAQVIKNNSKAYL